MMKPKQILLAGVLGGIVVYIWGAISWTLLPWHAASLRSLPNEAAVAAALRQGAPATGTYTFPAVPDDDAYDRMTEAEQKAWMAEYAEAPQGLVVYFERGGDPMNPGPFISGLMLYVLSSILAAYLLALAVPSLPTFGRRMSYVTMLGIFAALVSHIMQMNWSFQTLDYSLGQAADLVIGWTLAGGVIAWRVKEN